MRMEPKAVEWNSFIVEEIEEDKRLQNLPEIGWAHQTGDRSVAVAAGAPGDPTLGAPRDRCGKGHWEFSRFPAVRPRRRSAGGRRSPCGRARCRGWPPRGPS